MEAKRMSLESSSCIYCKGKLRSKKKNFHVKCKKEIERFNAKKECSIVCSCVECCKDFKKWLKKFMDIDMTPYQEELLGFTRELQRQLPAVPYGTPPPFTERTTDNTRRIHVVGTPYSYNNDVFSRLFAGIDMARSDAEPAYVTMYQRYGTSILRTIANSLITSTLTTAQAIPIARGHNAELLIVDDVIEE